MSNSVKSKGCGCKNKNSFVKREKNEKLKIVQEKLKDKIKKTQYFT